MDINDVVSKDEVDALLDDSAEQHSQDTLEDVDAYDFSLHAQKSVNDLTKLEMINELFTSEIRTKISHFLARNAYITSEPAQIVNYKEYVSTITKPTTIYFVAMKPLTGISIINFSAELVNKLIEVLFGGNINDDDKAERDYSKIELRITQLLLSMINESLSSSWNIIKPLKYEVIKSTTKPSMLAKHENEKTIVTNYKLCIEKQEWSFSHCIPMSTLEPILHVIEGHDDDEIDSAEQQAWSHAFIQNVYNVSTEVTAVVANTTIKLQELRQLKIGDIISIENPSKAKIYTGEQLKYYAKCGLSNGNRAIKILDKVQE